ncbi:MAG: hypothetical protein OXF98_01785, partial [Rhodospirillaceae bacterium]|nr:hypothetical protein [Rhodospirillaceae bacterium]
YLFEAGETVALDFIDALETARGLIGEQPGSGSPRYARELDIPGLRFRIVGRFPSASVSRNRSACPVWASGTTPRTGCTVAIRPNTTAPLPSLRTAFPWADRG